MGHNQLNGSLPQEWSRLTDLHTLVLANNRLSGVLPIWLSELKELKQLQVNKNELVGVVPAQFSTLRKLTILKAHENSLTGTSCPQVVSHVCFVSASILGGMSCQHPAFPHRQLVCVTKHIHVKSIFSQGIVIYGCEPICM